MIRFLIRTGILLVANAVGLIVASAILDDFEIDVGSFFIAVVLFTVVLALMIPFMASVLRRGGSSALGGVALIATLISLVITNFISDGFAISGVTTWILASVIIWVASLLAAFILPFLGLKKYLEDK